MFRFCNNCHEWARCFVFLIHHVGSYIDSCLTFKKVFLQSFDIRWLFYL